MSVLENRNLLESGQLLTPFEKQIINLIKLTCDSFSPTKIVARIVGGWVRDKLLGSQSDDIDFSIEGIDGLSFANKIGEVASREEFPHLKIHGNPEQSAHIGSAKVYLNPDFYIDICGLRWDQYSEDSRIPIITVGTPEQDALRRDFTINAVFFNINEFKVEDFCNGIPDLQNHFIRTTQPARQSFLDDPLRILRAFRFGARYNFDLADDIIPAALNEVTQREYASKTTIERANTEMTKALEGLNPELYVKWVSDSNMFDLLFDRNHSYKIDPIQAVSRISVVSSSVSPEALDNSKKEFLILILCAIFQPLINSPKVKPNPKKSQEIDAVKYQIIREVKYQNEIGDAVFNLLRGAEDVKALVGNELNRINVGHFIRNTGPKWHLVQYVLFDQNTTQFFVEVLMPFIEQQELGNIYQIKPLLRGNQLAKELGIKPGKGMEEIINRMIDWQIENPNGTADDYVASLKQ